MNPKTQAKAFVAATFAVAEAVRELKSVPSGHLYAQLMSHLDLPAYEKIVGVLKEAGVVREENYLLTWVGPEGGAR